LIVVSVFESKLGVPIVVEPSTYSKVKSADLVIGPELTFSESALTFQVAVIVNS